MSLEGARLDLTADLSIEVDGAPVRVTAEGADLRVAAADVRGFMLGETRRTPAGELVVWELVLFSPTSYRWHRTDWPETGFTPEVIRCTTAI